MRSRDAIRSEVQKLETLVHAGKIPTTDESGGRCWLRPGGAFAVIRESLRGNVDREQAALWARTDAEGEGLIFQMVKQTSIECLVGDK